MKLIPEKTRDSLRDLGERARSIPRSMVTQPIRRALRRGGTIGEWGPIRGTKRFLYNGERYRTVIEFSPTIVKVARLRVRRRESQFLSLQVHNCLGMSDPEIEDLLRKKAVPGQESPGASTGSHGEIILLLPLCRAISRTVRLPSHLDEEIRDIIELQIQHLVPLQPEEIIYGYRIASKDRDGYSTVYLSIVDRAVVNRYVELLGAIGLEPDSVRLNSEGIIDFLRCPEMELEIPGGHVTAIVDIDQDVTNVGLAVNGRLAFTRHIGVHAIDLLKPGSVSGYPAKKTGPEYLADELLRTFALFAKETGQQSVTGIILSGVPEACRAVRDRIEDALGLGVEALNPLDLLRSRAFVHDTPATSIEIEGVSLTAVLGQLTRADSAEIELLPGELIARRRRLARRRVILKTVSLAAITVGLIAGVAHRELSRREAYLRSLETQLTTLMPVATRVEGIEERLDIINGRIENKGLALDLIREVYRVVPPDISLNLFSYTREKAVVLKGSAVNMSDVFAFVPKLEESSLFRNVSVGYASKRIAGDREMTDFQLNMVVEGEAE